MEPVEDTDGKSHMTEYSPDVGTIELYFDSLVIIAPDQKGFHDVDSKVGHDQESDHIATFHLSLSRDGVGTSPESVDNHGSLYQDLH